MKLRVIGKDFLALFTGHGLAKAIAFGSTVVLARALPTESVALYATMLTILGYMQAVVNWGSDAIGIRAVAGRGVTPFDAITAVRKFRILSGLIVAGLGAGACLLMGVKPSVVLPLSLCMGALALRLDWLLLAEGRAAGVGLAMVSREIVFLVLVAAMALARAGLEWVLWGVLAAELAWSGVTILLASRPPAPLGVDGKFSSRYLLIEGLPIMFVSLLSITNNKIDVPLLARFRPSAEVASYWAAYNVLFAAMAVAALFTRASLPEMSRQAGRSSEEGLAGTFRFALLSGTGGCTAALVLGAGAPWIVGAVYGPALAAGSVPLRILVLALPAHFLAAILIGRLVAEGKQRIWTGACLIAAAANVGLNLYFIPTHGFVAAAWATVASEWVMFLGMVLAFRGRVAHGAFLWNATWVIGCFILGTLALRSAGLTVFGAGLLVVVTSALLLLPALQWVPKRMRLAGAAEVWA